MAMLLILFLCLSSVYSEEMKMMMKDMMSEKMDDSAMAVSKLKRDSYHHPSTPCPPYWPHMPEHPKVHVVQQPHYVQKPMVTVVKPHEPSYHGWSKPSYWPMSHVPQYHPQVPQYHPQVPQYHPQVPQYHHPVYPQYHHPVVPQYHKPIIHKPIIPQYHKPAVIVKPDCPPYHQPHVPHRTGIVYAPQHQYHHPSPVKYVHPQPQYVKVAKPVYQPPPAYHPPPVYHQPVYHHPSPPVHVPVHPVHPVHVPKVEICDK